jgi:Mycobacterial cell wall arabinan synthesis protein
MTAAERETDALSRTRLNVAQVLALIGLVAAFVGALGPAERIRTTYAWPPQSLPEGRPKQLWYTPLLLARHRPETLSAKLPCSLSPPLAAAGPEATVLATARYPERAGGLSVLRRAGRGDRLEIAVGEDLLAETGTAGCPYELNLASGAWSLASGSGETRQGLLERMPTVNGLFSELDLRAGSSPSVVVDTGVHASRTVARQTVAWVVAALALMAALALVAFPRRPRRPSGLFRRAAKAARPMDAVVGVTLLGWWVLSPAFWDDGWVATRERMFESARGFSNYYDSLAGFLPVAYWLEWSQHWLTQSVEALLWLRVPSLLLLAATWVLCRWVLARIVEPSSVALWALGVTFLVGALAGGMTLRPEPVTAFFVVAVLACVVRFREHESAAPLALVTVLVPLAVLGHPAGVISLAPLLVSAPSIFRWAQRNVPVAGTLLTSGIGLFAVLAFVGSDLTQRRADAQWTRTYGPHADWRDEFLRYAFLQDYAYGTPMRRLFVALIGLAVLGFLLRRRTSFTMLDLPSASLGLMLVLQLATPSRHPFQFGAFIGIAAVAVAAETVRLQEAAGSSRGWRARPFLVLFAATLAAAWTWSPRHGWNPLDLRTLEWTLAIEDSLPLQSLAVGLPVLVLVGGLLTARLRGSAGSDVPWRVSAWAAPLLAVPLIAFTVGVLAGDAIQTDGWTLTRQNLDTLRGDLGCGLADFERVADRSTVRALPVAAAGAEPWAAQAEIGNVDGFEAFQLDPLGTGVDRTPWLRLPAHGRYGIMVLTALPLGSDHRLVVEFGRRREAAVERLGGSALDPGVVDEVFSDNATQHLFGPTEVPRPDPEADVVRLVRVEGAERDGAIVVAAPVTFAGKPLDDELHTDDSRSLVLPPLVTYLPCARLPQLGKGVVEVPGHVVSANIEFNPIGGAATSPFLGLLDLYRVERLPRAEADGAPDEITVFRVDRRIPGALEAPPDAATVTS